MPLYEYRCLTCDRHTEKRQKFSDVEITICPYCGGTLERVISAPAIQFKGGGWYADLYSSGGKKKSADSATASDGSSSKAESGKTESGKSETGSESKPSAPTESKPAAAAAAPSTPTPSAKSE